MKRISWILAGLAMFVLFVLGAFFGHLLPQRLQGVAAGPPEPPQSGKTVDPVLLHARLGLLFVPTGSTVEPPITKDQAIAKALQVSPGLATATSASYQLGYLSDPGAIIESQNGETVDPSVANPVLVWVIIFDGIHNVSSGPPELAQHGVSNETNVSINANTGDYIGEFIYR